MNIQEQKANSKYFSYRRLCTTAATKKIKANGVEYGSERDMYGGCCVLRTVAVCVSKALVAGVSAVVDSVADVGRVDALAAGQTLECAVAGRRCSRRAGHRHPRFAVLHAAAAAAAATSGTHRVCPAGRLLVTVGRPPVSRRMRRSAANSAPLPPLPLICRPTQHTRH